MSTSLSLTDALAASVDASERCWRAGHLLYKLGDDLTQLALYHAIKACTGKKFVTEGARKLGKSYLHGVIALEAALQNPGKQVNWVTATKLACRQILLPILEEISADAPPDCAGHYNGQDSRWELPNGSYIQLVGAETKKDCEKSRGPSSILTIGDEAGFIELLEYLLNSVLKFQMRRIKRKVGTFVGLTLLVSTTPYFPSHHFCKVADLADVQGAYRRLTIYNSGFESPAEIDAYIADEAADRGMSVEEFKKTSEFRREFESIRVVDEQKIAFPEWHDLEVRARCLVDWPRPAGFERFVRKRIGVDLGMGEGEGTGDKTGLLFGYVDFLAAKAVVEDEQLLTRANTADITKAIKDTEAGLWQGCDARHMSIAVDDQQGRVVLDLWELQQVRADKAIKNDRDASIALVRTMLKSGKLIISPKCVNLRKQLLEATRAKSRRDFERNSEGHYDLCAALMYFVRGLDFTTNPYPADFNHETGELMPTTHPLVARREAMQQGVPLRGLAAQILGGNRFVAGRLRRR